METYQPIHHVGIIKRTGALMQPATRQEKLLWSKLKNRQLDGFRFRRRHPLGPYIVDFYCRKAKLVVELDSGADKTDEQLDDDGNRRIYLELSGIRVYRFSHHSIDNHLHAVVERIKRGLEMGTDRTALQFFLE